MVTRTYDSAITADELERILDLAERKRLRWLKVTVPNQIVGEPSILVEFNFKDPPKAPVDERATEEKLGDAY